MKKIIMTKYGFIRNEARDFTDDGNRFRIYTTSDDRIRVSYLKADGMLYISARLEDDRLNYDEYSNLKSYKELDDLNGVVESTVDDEALNKLYNACLDYAKEYDEKFKEVKKDNPSEAQLMEVEMAIRNKRELEYGEICRRMKPSLMLKLNKYEMSDFVDYFKNLAAYCQMKSNIDYYLNSGAGRERIKQYKSGKMHELEDGFYYTQLLKLLEKAGL